MSANRLLGLRRKFTTKNAHTQVKRENISQNDRFYLSHRPIFIQRKLAYIGMEMGYERCKPVCEIFLSEL